MDPRSRTTTTMTFPAVREQIGRLRQWARDTVPKLVLGLDDKQRDELLGDVVAVLSELGANAVVHGCGGERPDVELTATLELTPVGALRVSVTDPSPRRPEHRSAGDDATSGRGLQIVCGTARRFGVEDGADGGKVVWAEFHLPATVTADMVQQTIATLRAASAVTALRPRPVVGTLPARSALTRIPVSAA
ncbi:ATP-binding protein [Kitasatospora xanthocidica]|uniref:ATP-binding protein n=1 Tax=Kitasatospora xanthocidica TaxID=83382 RepID=UPI0036E7593D